MSIMSAEKTAGNPGWTLGSLSRHSSVFPRLFSFSSILPRFFEGIWTCGHFSPCSDSSSLFVEFVVCSSSVQTWFTNWDIQGERWGIKRRATFDKLLRGQIAMTLVRWETERTDTEPGAWGRPAFKAHGRKLRCFGQALSNLTWVAVRAGDEDHRSGHRWPPVWRGDAGAEAYILTDYALLPTW